MTYDEGFAAGMRRAAEITLLHMKDFCDSEDIVTSETNRTLKDVSAAILAAIPASAPAHPGGEPMTPDKLAAAGLRVKPLEWSTEDNGEFIAVSDVGWYHIGRPASSWNLTMPCGDIPGFGDDLEAAKAAAQADYESRILAALDEVSDE